ncbi:MAG: rRNA maturation RNase YbeY [Alphaproteobacteria bacterium]|jgi:probable rRNA maturation factor
MSANAEPDPEPDSPRDIIVTVNGWRAAPFDGDAAEVISSQAIEAATAELRLNGDTGLALLLADNTTLRQLNLDYRGKDQPTNVLSFPAFPPDQVPNAGHLGDIAVALETVIQESVDACKLPLHHLAHMVVHGVVHLAGYDHVTDAEAEEMEAIEVRALARLGIANPYQDGIEA